jgi:hypothetical protein
MRGDREDALPLEEPADVTQWLHELIADCTTAEARIGVAKVFAIYLDWQQQREAA